MFQTLARRKGNTTKTPRMHGMENLGKIMSFGVMEMPVQGSNPGASRGIFWGNNYGLPHPSSTQTIQGGLSPLDWSRLPSFPNLDSGAHQRVLWLSRFLPRISVKRFLSKASCFPRHFPRFSRGLCPLALPRSVQVFPSCQVGWGISDNWYQRDGCEGGASAAL